MKLKELIKEAEKRQQEVAEWMEKNWGEREYRCRIKKMGTIPRPHQYRSKNCPSKKSM